MVQILQFSREVPRHADWTQQEIAEFYRVEAALTQAGVSLTSERGLTDEGDPWFVFCRADTGEVFIHFARFDSEYVIDGAGFGHVARGRHFATLVRDLVGGEAFQLAKLRPRQGNVFLHPAALLIALVGAAFFHTSDAKAAEAGDGGATAPRKAHPLSLVFVVRSDAPAPLGLEAAQADTVVAGILIGMDAQRALPLAPEAPPPPEQAALSDWLSAPAPAVARHASAVSETRAAAAAAVEATVAEPAPQLHAAVIAPPPPETSTPDLTVADLSRLSDFAVSVPAAANLLDTDHVTLARAISLDRGVFLETQMVVLPNDGAGDVIRDLSGADQTQAAVVAKLPDSVAQLIEHGAKLGAVPTLGTGSTTHTGAVEGPPPASLGAPAVGSGVAAAPSAGAVFQPHDPMIDQAVASFMTLVAHWGVMLSGRDLVVYDTDIFGPHGAGQLDSVTFTFSDGSSISLVGTAAELSSAHLLH